VINSIVLIVINVKKPANMFGALSSSYTYTLASANLCTENENFVFTTNGERLLNGT